MADPNDHQFHWQWWHNLIVGAPLYFKKVRDFIWKMLKLKAKEELNEEKKDPIYRSEYEARQKEVMDGQREIRELIIGSEDRMQAAFHGAVAEHKNTLAHMDERWDNRLALLEKTFLDSRLTKQ